MIDLRSDTVTRPSAGMRRAMAAAEVGDDVYGEDPTATALQEAAAARFGREAALLLPSGVMCNQVWLRVLVRPGTEVLLESDAHIVNYEGAAGALLGGVQFRTVAAGAGSRGRLSVGDVRANLRAAHFPLTPTGLVAVEQTTNRGGGAVYDLGELRAIGALCVEAGVPLYMDGARVFNAAAAAEVDVADYGAAVSGLMFCVSKGLGAPIGSLMVGDTEAIEEAREWRRRYGGAMRQVGVIAAAALYALQHNVERLAEDHANARLLAEAAAEVVPEAVDPSTVSTNIVYLEGLDAPALAGALRGAGVLAGAMDARTLRLVTHLDVSAADAVRAADVLRRSLASVPSVNSG